MLLILIAGLRARQVPKHSVQLWSQVRFHSAKVRGGEKAADPLKTHGGYSLAGIA